MSGLKAQVEFFPGKGRHVRGRYIGPEGGEESFSGILPSWECPELFTHDERHPFGIAAERLK